MGASCLRSCSQQFFGLTCSVIENIPVLTSPRFPGWLQLGVMVARITIHECNHKELELNCNNKQPL